MTDRLYLVDRATAGMARVTAMGEGPDGCWVRLDRTWFHPQGGGQKADSGLIGGAAVRHVINDEGGDVLHLLQTPASFSVGDEVAVQVDAERRALHERLHTAGHLIAAIGEEHFPSLSAKAGHHWPGEARVDFFGDEFPDTDAFREGVTKAVEKAIAADLPVYMDGDPDSSREIRIGEHAGVGCGGTHVASLSSIGGIEIRKIKSKSGRFRVSYEAV